MRREERRHLRPHGRRRRFVTRSRPLCKKPSPQVERIHAAGQRTEPVDGSIVRFDDQDAAVRLGDPRHLAQGLPEITYVLQDGDTVGRIEHRVLEWQAARVSCGIVRTGIDPAGRLAGLAQPLHEQIDSIQLHLSKPQPGEGNFTSARAAADVQDPFTRAGAQ